MKKLCVGFIAVVLAFSFTSCSTNETDLEIPQEPLLKKAQLKRDANGAYYLDYVVAGNTVSDTRLGLNSLTNEFHLSKVTHDTKDKYREDLSLNDNKLRIGFFDAETGKTTKFTVEDKNITLAKGETNNDFLKTYSLGINDDGTILLDFKVNNNVVVEFIYNDKLEIYEVHLSKGVSAHSVFSRTIPMPDKGILKIDFVNHKLLGKGLTETIEKRPREIIETFY